MTDSVDTIPGMVAVEMGFPRGVADPECPNGCLLDETTDRRLLWHLETQLAVSGTTDHLRDLGRRVARYLYRTCDHHWHEHAAEPDIPAHRQCLWCNDVIWLDGDPLNGG